MAKRRERSDGRVVPEGRRKPTPTAETRGGKATTASEEVGQLGLFLEQLKARKGPVPDMADQTAGRRTTVPKSKNTSSTDPPAMTMEEVASDENLRRAFE